MYGYRDIANYFTENLKKKNTGAIYEPSTLSSLSLQADTCLE
jgi:hypothetical protein